KCQCCCAHWSSLPLAMLPCGLNCFYDRSRPGGSHPVRQFEITVRRGYASTGKAVTGRSRGSLTLCDQGFPNMPRQVGYLKASERESGAQPTCQPSAPVEKNRGGD